MIKKILILFIAGIFYALINASFVLAVNILEKEFCTPGDPSARCATGLSCLKDKDGRYICQPTFGTIQPPDAIKNLIGKDPTGRAAISKFLSNMVGLIYLAAGVVLIFMILWGAFDWLTSGGDKEKLDSARKKIINAFIGLMLFAVAFAVIQVLGQFTGFKFFEGQKP